MSDNQDMPTATLAPKQRVAPSRRPPAVEPHPAPDFNRLVALASPDLGRRIVEAARLAAAAHQILDALDAEARP